MKVLTLSLRRKPIINETCFFVWKQNMLKATLSSYQKIIIYHDFLQNSGNEKQIKSKFLYFDSFMLYILTSVSVLHSKRWLKYYAFLTFCAWKLKKRKKGKNLQQNFTKNDVVKFASKRWSSGFSLVKIYNSFSLNSKNEWGSKHVWPKFSQRIFS